MATILGLAAFLSPALLGKQSATPNSSPTHSTGATSDPQFSPLVFIYFLSGYIMYYMKMFGIAA